MAQEPANHTIKVLQEMRTEMREGFNEMRAEMRELAVGIAALSADLKLLRGEVTGDKRKAGRRFNTLEERVRALEEHTGIVDAPDA